MHKPAKIIEIRNECDNVKTFSLDGDMKKAVPGQFAMVWMPGVAERPITPSSTEPLEFTVKRFDGPESLFTPAMFGLKEGDTIFYRGPLGNGFPVDEMRKCSVLYNVGGGFGPTPLPLLAESVGTNVVTFLGAKTSSDLLFEDRLKKYGDVHIATEDGSRGKKGLVTDLLNDYNFSSDGNAAICGPEKMIYNAAKIIGRNLKHDKICGSFERLMKCAYGLCGSCALGHYRVCADGPVFSIDQVEKIPDFGNFKRDRAGRKEML